MASARLRSVLRLAPVLLALAAAACSSSAPPLGTPTAPPEAHALAPPSELFPGLFEDVALSGVVAPKDWVDAVPLQSPATILAAYDAEEPEGREELARFVADHFRLPQSEAAGASPRSALPMREHIEALWPRLVREASRAPQGGSLLALPNRYVVPGGRFREVYYWDAYFTMVGMGEEHDALKRDMVDNFAHLVGRLGFVPNANRTYYLSRSQPPFFFMMVALLSPDDEAAAFRLYLDALRREHAFWMDGADGLAPGEARRRAVRLADGALLNRYWDDRAAPRDESFAYDVETVAASDRPPQDVYRDLRAAAESGWDFSSRWLGDGRSLASIETTRIAPPDLNALLYGLERAIARGCARAGDEACVGEYAGRADARRAAMHAHLWSNELGAFVDYDAVAGARREQLTAAALYPLFFGVASREQARRTARAVERALLAPGGLLTTTEETGEQWDAPNGWAPLHWIAVRGLADYGEDELARAIAERWLATVSRTYCVTAKMVEKYDVAAVRPGGGGEYPLQDGFGWTNGITLALLDLHPGLARYGAAVPAPAGLSPQKAVELCAARSSASETAP